MTTRRMFGMCGLLLAAAASAAQDPKAAGPSRAKPGEPVPATFRAYLVTDDRFPPKVNPPAKPDDRDPRDRTGKVHCLVCETGLSPAVAVFVKADPKALGPDSGVVKLAARLNKLIPQYRADRMAAWVHFLRLDGPPKAVPVPGADAPVELDAEYPDDERRDEYAREVRDLAKAADAPNVPFGLAPAKGKMVDAWGIGPDDEVTVILFNRLKVANRWTFKADGPTPAQIDEIAAAVAAAVEGKK
ncbi:MAG: hypothetical protein K2X87_10605 [Gemmataceae bacterium]|nr:hypothetical protein [Gemmataceae bacterium]